MSHITHTYDTQRMTHMTHTYHTRRMSHMTQMYDTQRLRHMTHLYHTMHHSQHTRYVAHNTLYKYMYYGVCTGMSHTIPYIHMSHTMSYIYCVCNIPCIAHVDGMLHAIRVRHTVCPTCWWYVAHNTLHMYVLWHMYVCTEQGWAR